MSLIWYDIQDAMDDVDIEIFSNSQFFFVKAGNEWLKVGVDTEACFSGGDIFSPEEVSEPSPEEIRGLRHESQDDFDFFVKEKVEVGTVVFQVVTTWALIGEQWVSDHNSNIFLRREDAESYASAETERVNSEKSYWAKPTFKVVEVEVR